MLYKVIQCYINDASTAHYAAVTQRLCTPCLDLIKNAARASHQTSPLLDTLDEGPGLKPSCAHDDTCCCTPSDSTWTIRAFRAAKPDSPGTGARPCRTSKKPP